MKKIIISLLFIFFLHFILSSHDQFSDQIKNNLRSYLYNKSYLLPKYRINSPEFNEVKQPIRYKNKNFVLENESILYMNEILSRTGSFPLNRIDELENNISKVIQMSCEIQLQKGNYNSFKGQYFITKESLKEAIMILCPMWPFC